MRKRTVQIGLTFISCILFPPFVWAASIDCTIFKGSTQIHFNSVSNTIEIADSELGTILYNGVFEFRSSNDQFASSEQNSQLAVDTNSVKNELRIKIGEKAGIIVKFDLPDTINITANSSPETHISFRADSTCSNAGINAIAQKERATDCNVLFNTIGNVELGANALFDTKSDLLISAQSQSGSNWKWSNGWRLQTGVSDGELSFNILLTKHYYKDELGLGFFAPLHKTSFWQTAPVVALTWYGINTYGGDSKQKKEWLYPQIDFVSKNLLPYAGQMVFQLDDNYFFENDKYMRDISDYIRSKGMIPGIWFTPFSLTPPAVAKAHPDWFLHDNSGKLLTNFGGCNWGYIDGSQTYVINIHNPKAVDEWYGMFWRKVSDTWNYDYFKLDAAPNALQAYSTSVEGGGPYGYRKGLQIARSIIGPKKFINNCTGPLPASFGLIQGTRTGVDTAPYDHAIDVVQRWNFLNNVTLWCDADAIANSYQKNTELMHLNTAARALTGQQFLTDDMWTRMPAPALAAMQKAIPMLDIRPANLYKIENWKDYDVFDLKVSRPWSTWDVAGLFNYSGSSVTKKLDLSKLKLTSDQVHVYEYWSSTYLGKFSRNAKITRYVLPYDAQVFAIVPDQNRPVLLSTSRHITQGALELAEVTWSGNEQEWTVEGSSTNLVAGTKYEMVFAGLNYSAAKVKSEAPFKIISETGTIRVEFLPASSKIAWQITFKPVIKSALSITPEQIQLMPGETGTFTIFNLGHSRSKWTIISSDAKIKVTPGNGELASWPAFSNITVTADANGFSDPGSYECLLTAQDADNSKCISRVVVPVLAKNLAINAQVKVSSCATGYDPNYAHDSDTHTAWYSTVQDKNGAWIELSWDKPVKISRVVLDECTAQFKQVLAWHLEIDQNNSMTKVQSGTLLERQKSVKLDNPCLTSRIRFVVDKAVNMPGLWEFEIYEK